MFDATYVNESPGGRLGIDVNGFNVNEGDLRRIGVIASFLKKEG